MTPQQLRLDGLAPDSVESQQRKRSQLAPKTIRVSAGIAEACKQLDQRYRESLTAPETEQAMLISLNERAMVIKTNARDRILAEELVDELLSGQLAELSTNEKKVFAALLIERLMDLYPDEVIYPQEQQ